MSGFAKTLAGAVAILVALFAVNAMMSRAGLFGFGLGGYGMEVLMLVGINVILAVSLNLINGFTGQFSIGHAGFMAIGAYTSAMVSIHWGVPWVDSISHAGVPVALARDVALV